MAFSYFEDNCSIHRKKCCFLMPENDAKIGNLSCFLNKNEREKNDSRGILHCASNIILSVFLANKNKINSLFNVLNVISFFTKNSFSPSYSSKFTKKRLRKWLIPCPSTDPKRFLTGLNSFRIRPNRFQQIQKCLFSAELSFLTHIQTNLDWSKIVFRLLEGRGIKKVCYLSTTISYPQVPIIIF